MAPAIVADNRYIEKALQNLIRLLRDAGATLADGLMIRCIAGNLSIAAPTVRRGAMLTRMPADCLVPLVALDLALLNEEIVISQVRPGLKTATLAITEAMVETYNLAGKVAQHRRTSPWSLIAAHPELLSYIAPPARDDFPFSAQDIQAGNDAKVVLASFLHSRLFAHNPSGQGRSRPVLVPVTDFLNHHWKGEPYSYGSRGAVVMRCSAPLREDDDECFASYGLHDAHDTWIAYGFVDADVPFVQSLATTVDLPGVGTIRLGEVPLARGNGTGLSVQNLRSYIPRTLRRKGNHLSVAAAMIPGPQAPRALRRGLRMLINELGAPGQRHHDLVMRAEEQILDANLTYYGELKSCLQGLSIESPVHAAIRANFVQLCEGQIARLRDYQNYATG